MFDGSHRTNRREINLAGRASRSNRTSTLKEARSQRLARAEAKAKSTAVTLLQRRWRGVRRGSGDGIGRKGIAALFRGDFDRVGADLQNETDAVKKIEISRMTALLAFRMSHALIQFYNETDGETIFQDLLSLESLLRPFYKESSSVLVTPVQAKRLIITILVLLRRSYRYDVTKNEQDERRLIQLLDYLMQFVQGANNGWSIHLFLCLRDSYLCKSSLCREDSMDVDESEEEVQKILLKWCSFTVVSLQKDQRGIYQHGLALLGSIVFVAGLTSSALPSWMETELTNMITLLEQSMCNQSDLGGKGASSSEWRSILVHFLSRGMNDISKSTFQPTNNIKTGRVISETTSTLSVSSPLSPDLLLSALSDTITSREHIILDQVLSFADVYKSSLQNQQVFTYSVPSMFQYALQQQQELAILASFAARGDDIMSWLTNSAESTLELAVSAIATTGAAYEDSDSDSDSEQFQQPNQLHQQIQNTARQSRADLQTMPKLDNLYQTSLLQSKKRFIDKLQTDVTSRGEETKRFALAAKIGGGSLVQQIGDAIFSSSPKKERLNGLLSLCTIESMQNQACKSYVSCLATIMTACSGLKAGRNASSPLLAKLAFHESLLHGIWGIAEESASIITISLVTSSSLSSADANYMSAAYETLSAFCDIFAHWNLATDDDLFLQKYHNTDLTEKSLAKELVITLKNILNELYWVRPVLAADISGRQTSFNDRDAEFRFQRARLMLSGTKLWNCMYERWCRLRNVKFCDEDAWWFPQLASRGAHDNNPIIHSQVTSVGQDDDLMEESSIEGDEAAATNIIGNNDAGMDALATSFRDPKVARILTFIPQAMPFYRRVDLFQNLLESDKAKTQDESAAFRQMMMNWDSEGDSYSGREKVTIHRDSLYSDSMSSLMPLGKKLRKKLQVTFVNQHGIEEAGIDGGGVQKEFFDDLIKDAFLPSASQHDNSSQGGGNSSAPAHPDFFVETSIETLQVNTALSSDEYLRHYEFLGRVLGKTMYESILVDPQFSLPFLNKVLGKQNTLDDLKNLDPEYYKHLKSLRYMSAKDIASLGLTFEINVSAADRLGHSTVELIPGGREAAVTKENVIQYIHLVSHQRMNVAGARQTAAFLHGFREIIPAPWVRLFSAYEFQKLISGDDTVKG
jgi:ubiquitin-protein ligase E3 C